MGERQILSGPLESGYREFRDDVGAGDCQNREPPGFRLCLSEYQEALANETFNALINRVKQLNREILEDKSLGRGFQIGHSYFCGRAVLGCTDEWMRSVVEFDLLPTLGEYWFDEPKKLAYWEKNLRGVFDD